MLNKLIDGDKEINIIMTNTYESKSEYDKFMCINHLKNGMQLKEITELLRKIDRSNHKKIIIEIKYTTNFHKKNKTLIHKDAIITGNDIDIFNKIKEGYINMGIDRIRRKHRLKNNLE